MKPAKVVLAQQHDKYQLLVNGEPFYIKGAGLEFGSIESLAVHGGNAFRTWRVDNGVMSGREVLDKAHELGLMVCMGLDLGRERRGFDYDDVAAVQQQFDSVKRDVIALKDHPALLMWGIGNELNLHYSNHKVWDAVNDIAAMIHQEDPNHPTTTMLAGAEANDIRQFTQRCPEVDLLSLQLYGKIELIEQYIANSGYSGAYIVSEWGATGHWEVPVTSWDQPLEQSSHEKALAIRQRYQRYILNGPENCIGSFVFLWGQKQERTPTWYGIFLEDGAKTAAVDAMQYVWTGSWPKQRAPILRAMHIEGLVAADDIHLKAGEMYRAQMQIDHHDANGLAFRWVIMGEVDPALRSEGGDFEPTPAIVATFDNSDVRQDIEFIAPGRGEYRLYGYASDKQAGTATANIPFRVK